jgi:hypothetical protein
MSILFADPGGEPYFSLGMPGGNVWTTNNSMTLVSNAPSGRRTTFAINGGGSGFGMERAIAGNPAHIIAGVAVYIPAAWLNGSDTPIIQFKDAGTAQIDCRVTSTGAMRITRNGTSLALSSNLLTNGSGWHYIELDATINPTTGAATVWVDGVNWVSVSGTNTRATSNSFAGTVRFYAGQSGQPASQWKDMYALDPSSGLYSAPLGDTDVAVVYPNAAGVNQQWTNTGGASQTASVQDGRSGAGTRPDGDTSYISDSVSGHISDFAHDTLTAGSIFAVIHMTYARSDAGTATFNQVTLSNGTTRSTSQSVGASYSYVSDVMETDPHTAAAWTLANFNAATFGAGIP